MSEDEQRSGKNDEAGDEVEAHKRSAAANEEAGDETENDVEGHMRKSAPGEESTRGA